MHIQKAVASVLVVTLISSSAIAQEPTATPATTTTATPSATSTANTKRTRQVRRQQAKPETRQDSLTDAKDESKQEKQEARLENKTAQEIADLVKDLDYPELQVVPRASDRLRLEARDEGRGWFFQHWPIQLSGLATLATATYGKGQIRESSSATFDDDADRVLMVGQIVGAGWFLGGALWGLRRPYRKGLSDISKIQGRDTRAQLMRERLAEEALESPAKLVKPLRYASVVTNFALAVLMANYLTDEGRVIAAGAATLAFVPFIYDDPTVYTWEKHQEYKRKIYGPVSSTGFGVDRTSQRLVPTTTLTWNF